MINATELDRAYELASRDICQLSAKYGHNSPEHYLHDYAPRMKHQIRTLLGLMEKRGAGTTRLLSIGGWPGITGLVLSRLCDVTVTLIDHPAVLVEEFAAFYRANGMRPVAYDFADSVAGPLPLEGDFDLIECCQCIEHWNFNPVFAFQDLFARVLSAEGRMLITVPNAVCLYRRLFTLFGHNPYPAMQSFIDVAEGVPGAEVAPHWREYTQDDLVRLVKAAGGACESRAMRQYRLLYPMSLAQRIHQLLHNVHPKLRATVEVIAKQKSR